MKNASRPFSLPARRLFAALMALAACSSLPSVFATSATWNGTTDATWAGANWSASPVPGTGEIATFDNAGNAFTTINLGSGVTIGTVIFDTSSAAAYTIGSGAVGSQALTLNNAGAVTMNSTVANNELFNAAITLGTDATVSTYTFTNNSTTNRLTFAGNITGGSTGTAGAKTLAVTGSGDTFISGNLANGGATSLVLTKTGTGTLTLSGANTNTGTTTITAGTLKLGASNAMTSTGAVTLSTGGLTNIFDLAGFSQAIGTLTSGGTNDSAGIITSSATGGALTVNVGTTTGNTFGGTRFTGTLALTILANNVTTTGGGNIQMLNTNNSFSGGLRVQGSSGTFTTANLATAGQFTGLTMAGLRTSAAAAIGTGTVTLDNGQLFFVASQNVSNAINVTAKGGMLHMEGTGAAAAGGFTGTLSSSASTLLVINSNAGNTNLVKISGDMSGFSGTLALDTTNIGGIALSGSALGNASTNLLWYGNGTNGGTGRVQWNGTGSTTLTFGELNNLNSGAVGSTMSGIMENNVASTTATYSIGNTNSTAATFQGVIRNGVGTVALTKTGTNTQVLSGTNTYTGATTISGGTLSITGSLAAGSAVGVSSGGTLRGTGTIGGATTVASGGFLAAGVDASTIGTFTFSSTLATASGATVSLKLNSTSGTFDLIAANGLTLGNATLSLTELGSGTWTGTSTFTLINNTSGSSVSGTFLGLAEGATVTVGSNNFTLSYLGGTGNDITLTASAIPEPSTYAVLAGLGVLGLAACRRRRTA